MNIPRLGEVTKGKYGEYRSQPIPVTVLGGKKCCFELEDYDQDTDKEAFHVAIANFLDLDASVLLAAGPHVFQYYKDSEDCWQEEDEDFKPIKSPAGVWAHVHLGKTPTVSRRSRGDKGIYISLECNCDWEQEHGLQIVFQNGLKVNKVGPFDGHLTNEDAYGDNRLESVVYRVHG